MIKIKCEEDKKISLEKLRKSKDRFNSERALYVLLANEGKTVEEIAHQTCRHPNTIRKWLNAYLKEGLEGLKGRPLTGGPKPVKSSYLQRELEKLLSVPPGHYGYQHAGWTIGLLVEQFATQNCHVSISTVSRALNKGGWTYKRFAKTVPRCAPGQEEKRERIEDMMIDIGKQKPDVILFLDETHFSSEPYIQKGWFKRGEKKRSKHRKGAHPALSLER